MTIMNKYFSKALNELSLNKLILIFATRFIKCNFLKKYKNLHCTTSSPIHPWISSIVIVQGTISLEATTESIVNVHLVDFPLVCRELLKLHMLHWTHHLHKHQEIHDMTNSKHKQWISQ